MAILHMNLFSNTVMITIHPVRKYSSFTGYKSISCFLFLFFEQEWRADFVYKHFCLRCEKKLEFPTKISGPRFCSTWNCLILMNEHRRSYLIMKTPARPLPSLRLFCKLMAFSLFWIWSSEMVLNAFNAMREKHNAGTPVPVKLWNKATCLVCQPEVWRETSEDNRKIKLHKIFLFIL